MGYGAGSAKTQAVKSQHIARAFRCVMIRIVRKSWADERKYRLQAWLNNEDVDGRGGKKVPYFIIIFILNLLPSLTT
jgi:hypothetical protein